MGYGLPDGRHNAIVVSTSAAEYRTKSVLGHTVTTEVGHGRIAVCWCLVCLRGECAGSTVEAKVPTKLQPIESLRLFLYTNTKARKTDRTQQSQEVGETARLDATQTGALLSARVLTGEKCLISSFGIARGMCVDIPLAVTAISLGTGVSVPVAQQRRTCVAEPVAAQRLLKVRAPRSGRYRSM